MSLIPISTLANGTLFDLQAALEGSPLLIPAAGISCQVFVHNTSTPATVKLDEFSGIDATPPFVTDQDGVVPGWIDPVDLPLDISVALAAGTKTFVLGPSPSSGLNQSTTDGLYVHQDGTGLPSKVLQALTGAAPLVDTSQFGQGSWLKYIGGKISARQGSFVDPRDGLPGVSNTACACDLTLLTDAVIGPDGSSNLNQLSSPSVSSGAAPPFQVGQLVNIDCNNVDGSSNPGVNLGTTISAIGAGGLTATLTDNVHVATAAATGTLASLIPEGAVTSIPLASPGLSTGSTVPAGTVISIVDETGQYTESFVLSADAHNSDVTLSVTSKKVNYLYGAGSTVTAAAIVRYATDDTTPLTNLHAALPTAAVKHVEFQSSMMVRGVPAPITGHFTARQGAGLYHHYGVNAATVGTSPPTSLAVDVSYEGVSFFGDAAPAGSATLMIGLLVSPTAGVGARVRVRDCYFQDYAQAGPFIKDCDLVDISHNWVINCATLFGGDNAINLLLVGKGGSGVVTQIVKWVCSDNIVGGPNGLGACIDIECLYGQAPGALGRITVHGNIVWGSLLFSGIAIETNGGVRNVSLIGNVAMDCASCFSLGDSSVGTFENTYSDIQNFTVQGNIGSSRSLTDSIGLGIFASNATVVGNVLIAQRPFSFVGSTGAGNIMRSVNSVMSSNVFVTAATPSGTLRPIGNISRVDMLSLLGNTFTCDSEVDWISLNPTFTASLGAALVNGTNYSTLTVPALTQAYTSGSFTVTNGSSHQTWTLTSAANVGDTVLHVTAQNANAAYPIGSQISSAGGTFTLTLATGDATGGYTFGTTGAIATTATPSALQTALLALLPSSMTSGAQAPLTVGVRSDTGHGSISADVAEVQFTGLLGARPMTLTANFGSTTGCTSPAVTRAIQGAICKDGVVMTDMSDANSANNIVKGAGWAGFNLTDVRDSDFSKERILEPSQQQVGASSGAGFRVQGDCGMVGMHVDGLSIYDRRVNAAGTATPFMTYGIDTSAVTNGRVYDRVVNRIPFWKTGKTNGTIYSFRSGRRNGQTGFLAPTSRGWSPSTVASTARRMYLTRFVPDEDFLVSAMTIITSVSSGTATDTVDVGIVDSTVATLIGSSGPTANLLSGTTNGLGKQILSVAAQVRAGQVYYAAVLPDGAAGGSFGSTAPTLRVASFVDATISSIATALAGTGSNVKGITETGHDNVSASSLAAAVTGTSLGLTVDFNGPIVYLEGVAN